MAKKLTRQQLFDECAQHVLQQGKPAMKHRTCVYLDDAGCSCAVGGPLVKRGLYSEHFEGRTVENVLNGVTLPEDMGRALLLGMALAEMGVQEEDLLMLHRIQQAHDNCAARDAYQADAARFIYTFKGDMRRVARDFGVSSAVVA